MGVLNDKISEAFRDFTTDGLESSGVNPVEKRVVRELGPLLESAISNASLGSLIDVVYATRAELDGDLAHDAGSVALVYADPLETNNDLYTKGGASGGGSWTLTTAFHDAVAGSSILQERVAAVILAQGGAETAKASAENWAQTILTVTAGQIVTELTDPVPANGTVEILLSQGGSQVWQVVAGAWSFVDWLSRLPGSLIKTSNPTASSTMPNLKLARFETERATIIDRVEVTITTALSNASLFEIGLYSEDYTRLAVSGPREANRAGRQSIALPDTDLPPGRYFFAITCNSSALEIEVNEFTGGMSAAATFPLPASPVAPAYDAKAPSVTLREKSLPALQGLFELETGRKWRVYGEDATSRQPWGFNTETFKMCVSMDSGATFEDRMNLPPDVLTTGGGIADLVVNGGQVFVLTNTLLLYRSSDLSSSATWEDISPPENSGMRSGIARGRPYGIGILSGHLFIGEYTQSPNEVRTTGQAPGPDPTRGPRIFRYDLAGGTWAVSAEFLEARHVHSIYRQGTVALWVSLGDAGWGNQIGLHRLVPSDIGTGPGGSDSWTKWTTPVAPRTDHYPVDFLLAGDADFDGEAWQERFLLTSDRPGFHLLEAARYNTVGGSVNIGAQLFRRPQGPAGETARSLVLDTDTGNAYYWTAETAEPGIYMSPPPYTRSVKLADHADPNLFRAIYTGGYVLMFNTRFKAEKFVGQE